MAEEQGQERTEQPSAKRLKEARERGQVARSRELATVILLLGAAAGLMLFGGSAAQALTELMRAGLQLGRETALAPDAILRGIERGTREAAWLIVPPLALLSVLSIMGPVALGGFTLSLDAVLPKFGRLDPVAGLGRMFSARALAELGKAIGKLLLIGFVAAWLLNGFARDLLGLATEAPQAGAAHAGVLLAQAFLALSAVLVLVALADVPFQIWSHLRQLRMTRQELREEYKETEGRPEVRGRIRQLQREVARRRMMQEVPKADVVITNPTHYAVALRYDPDRMGAPRVVAKGADLVALHIRTLAGEHRVAIFEAPPLARALYFSAELDQEIPAALYVAVAQVLAWVWQMKEVRRRGGPQPARPADLPVPEALTRDPRTARSRPRETPV